MTWDVVAVYVWFFLMAFVYNEVYHFVSRRRLLLFFAVLGVATGVLAVLL